MKRKIKLCILAVLCALSAAALLAACNQDKSGKASDTLYVGTVAVIESATRSEYNFDVMSTNITQLPLVGMNDEGEYYPVAATWSANNDSSEWTYTVRDGLEWHDGTPVTAEDILATLLYSEREGQEIFKGEAPRYRSYTLSGDGRSITLTLSEPNVREPGNMTTMRLVPASVYTADADRTPDDDKRVSAEDSRMGCGPFRFGKFDKNAGTITFVRNDGFFAGAPAVREIVVRLFGNEDTMYMALARGDIDTTWKYSGGLSAAAQTMLAERDNVALFTAAAKNNPAVLMFNNSKAPFDNENIRLAVRAALDYAQIRTLFASEYAAPAREGMIPPAVYGYCPTEELVQDTELAEELLRAEGYVAKDGEGYWIKDGKRLGFSLTYNSENAAQMRYAEAVRNSLAAFGMEVRMDGCEKATYQGKTTNKFGNNTPSHEAAIMTFTAAGTDMAGGLASIYIYGGHAVQGGAQVFDKQFENIYDDLQSASTDGEYTDAARRCQEYYAAHAPAVALYWDSYVYACDKRVSGFDIDANFGLFNLGTWASIEIR